MKALQAPTISRFLVVAVMLLSWFVLTNHCALARMTAQDEAECCHKKQQAPAKETPCEETAQCCHAVKALLSGKADAKFDSAKFQLQFCAIVQVLAAQLVAPERRAVFDHGPPRAISFAEAVLQRSLFSHAPPLAA